MCPVKSSADDGRGRPGRTPTFMSRFKELYEAAGGHSGGGISAPRKSGRQAWPQGGQEAIHRLVQQDAPPTKEHAKCVRDVLIPFLEDLAEVHSPGYRKHLRALGMSG